MSPVVTVIKDLDQKLKSSTGDERLNVLRSITDLFLGTAPQLSEDTIAVFDDVLSRLVDHIESRALIELSGKLAPIATAPSGVVRRLASDDDIRVAGPVLQLSDRLSVEDLVEIASTKPQGHLAAIAGRTVVEERVSDVLVVRGNTAVAAAVAANSGAKFSEAGMSKLIERAGKEESIAERVASRPEITPAQMRSLVERATETIRRRLTLRIAPEARVRLDNVLTEIAADLDKANSAPKRDYTAAHRFALSMQTDPALMRVTLREFAQNSVVEQSIALLSVLSGVPIPAVERVFTHGDEGGTLILCRAVELDWPATLAVLNLRSKIGRPATHTRDTALQQFNGLNTTTAQRVVRFWRVRASSMSGGNPVAMGAPS